MKKIVAYINIALLLTLPGVLVGCSYEREQGVKSSPEARTVTLKMAVPGANSATRAIGEGEENAIQTIDVLAFAVDGASEKYDYWTVGAPATDNVAGSSQQHFTVTLRISDHPQRFVVIANAHQQVNTLIASRDWTAAGKGDLLSKLEYAFPSGADRWNSASSADYTPIPMWGESGVETISSTTSRLTSDVSMMRMAARIDVQLDNTVAGLTSKFKLKSVSLYNTNTGGLVAPTAGVVADKQHLTDHYYYVTDTSIPAARQPFSARNTAAIKYTDFASPGTADVAMLGSIYTFEADDTALDAEAPCLVVGGIYGSDTVESFYRLDIVADDGTTRLPLLRNNRYLINVVDVTGAGHASAADAFSAKGVNIKATVLYWSENELDNIVFDGQYTLSTSKSGVTLYKNPYTGASIDGENTLTVFSDNPAGWKVEKIVDAADGTTAITWANLSPTSGAAGGKVASSVIASANQTGAARTAIIWISAGRLRYPLRVTQGTTAAPMSLSTTDASAQAVTQLVFSAAAGVAPASQQLNVKWAPTDKSVSVATAKDAGGSVAFPANSTTPSATTLTGGTKTYTIAPPALTSDELADPFYVKASKVDFTITDNETTITRSVVLKQLNYNIQVTPAAYYVMNGSTYTLNVRANTTWMIKSITQKGRNQNVKLLNNKSTDNLMMGVGSTGNTASPGDPLTFTVANTPGNWGTIDVTFTSPEGRFADKTITLVMAAKAISIIGVGIATSGEGGDKYNLIQYNTSNPSNAQGRVNTAPQKMMDTPANFGTTASSTVICEPFVANWMDQNLSGGTNYTLTAADVSWISDQNPDLVWIGGNGQWGDDVSLLIRQKFLDKGKTVVCSIQHQDTMWSMIRTIFGTTATSAWMSSNNYNSTPATFKFVNTADPILDGPFRNIHGEYWGSQYTGSYAFAVQGNSTDLIVTYSNGQNQSGGGQSLNGDATVWTSMFRAKNTNWIWICDDGFVRNDTPGDGSVSPFIISQSTYTPNSKSYGNSPQQYVQNSAFIANMLAWVVARNPKQ